MREFLFPKDGPGPITAALDTRGRALGPQAASIRILQYGDYESAGCLALYRAIKRLRLALNDEIRLAFRHAPLDHIHPNAMLAAEADEAAALQNRFWEMHDGLFEHQELLGPKAVVGLAIGMGLNMPEFQDAILSGAAKRRVLRDRQEAGGGPGLIVNGRRFEGPATYEALLAALR